MALKYAVKRANARCAISARSAIKGSPAIVDAVRFLSQCLQYLMNSACACLCANVRCPDFPIAQKHACAWWFTRGQNRRGR